MCPSLYICIYIRRHQKTKNIFPPYGQMAMCPYARNTFFKRKPSFIRCIPQKSPLRRGKKASTYIYKERIKTKKYPSPVRAHGNVPLCSKHFFQKKTFFCLMHSPKTPLAKTQKSSIIAPRDPKP
ncbi:hypothetical protein M2306_003213 [Myroides gitamensis]|nr:hypothetical protein [Myroides gitamensis]